MTDSSTKNPGPSLTARGDVKLDHYIPLLSAVHAADNAKMTVLAAEEFFEGEGEWIYPLSGRRPYA